MKRITWSAIKEDFNFNKIPEVYFWKSEWEFFDPHDSNASVSPWYFAYRFLYMCWFIGSTIQIFVCGKDYNNNLYLIFLTNQTFTLQLIYSVIYFFYMLWVVWRKYRKNSKNSYETYEFTFHEQNYSLPLYCKIIWIIISILQTVPYIVTFVYWAVLYNGHGNSGTCSIVNNILVHGMNSPLALLDLFIIAVPICPTHIVFPILAGFGYLLFTVLYEVFGGEYVGDFEFIYPILNWRNTPGLAVLSGFGVVLAAVVIYFVMWALSKFKIYIKSRFVNKI